MDFSALTDYLEKLPQDWGIPQCALILRQGRETVFEKPVNADRSDVYWLYSATKLFTATMFCRLLEQGKLKLEDAWKTGFPTICRNTRSLKSPMRKAKRGRHRSLC